MYKELKTNHELFRYLHKPSKEKDKPTILFSHGFRVPPHYYDPILDQLNDSGHEIIALDRYNTRPRPDTANNNLYHSALFIQALQPANNWVKLGHSLGGFITLKMQNYHMDAEKYIATNPAVPIQYGMGGFIKAGLEIGMKDLHDTVLDNKFRPKTMLKYIRALIDLDGRVLKNVMFAPQSTLGVMGSIKDINYKDVIFTNKHRIFQSTRDEFFPLDVVYNTLPATFITQMEGRHSFPLNQPNKMVDMLKKYLKQPNSMKELSSYI